MGLNRSSRQPIQVVVGILLKRFCAVRASAKAQRTSSMYYFDGRLKQLFSQAHGTHREIAHFVDVLLRVGDEHFNTAFTAEAMLLAVVTVGDGFVLADPQPDKGAATRGTNWRLHLHQPLTDYAIWFLVYDLPIVNISDFPNVCNEKSRELKNSIVSSSEEAMAASLSRR